MAPAQLFLVGTAAGEGGPGGIASIGQEGIRGWNREEKTLCPVREGEEPACGSCPPYAHPNHRNPSPTLWAAWVRVVSRRGKGGKSQQLVIMCALWRQDSAPNQGAKAVTGFST